MKVDQNDQKSIVSFLTDFKETFQNDDWFYDVEEDLEKYAAGATPE